MPDEGAMFEALIDASGVPVSEDEKADLRKTYATLMKLAERTRRPGRSWEVRTLPHFTPRAPGDDG